jgi:UDP-glucose 4-epimerase
VRVLVTGGAGFIGANLCRALAETEEFDRIVALDDLSTGRADNLTALDKVELVDGSVLDQVVLGELVSEADAVVHLAARPSVPRSLSDPVATHLANTEGTVSVLEAIRRRRQADRPHLLFSSSSSVYGANPGLPKREDMVARPQSPYAASKLAAESYALAYANSFGMRVLVLRLFNVFGPLQAADHAYAAVVPAFVSAALRDEPLTIHGDGTQTRDFTFVGSVVAVLMDCLRRGLTHPGPVNLAFGSRVSLLELIGSLEELLGRPLARRHTAPRAGDVTHSQADQRRLRSLVPEVVPVPLEEGLRATLDWARSEYRSPAR